MNIWELYQTAQNGEEYEVNGERWRVVREGETFNIKKPKDAYDYYTTIQSVKPLGYIFSADYKKIPRWDKIPADTKVLVSNDGKTWYKRYFSRCEDGYYYTWDSGKTSFTITQPKEVSQERWMCCKLYEE